MSCAPFPGGACTSSCGLTGDPCDGVCVETGRVGEVCLSGCKSDADCRKAEGYVCDPHWHACTPPAFSAIVPRACSGAEPARDARFGASEQWSTKSAPGLYQFEPAAVLTDDGGLVALYIGRGGRKDPNVLGVSRLDGKGALFLDQKLGSAKRSHFDPWLSRDRAGVLYAAWYGFDGRDEQGEIALSTSRDRGATWSEPSAVHDPADCPRDKAGCLDKPMLAIGPDPKKKAADILYVMYSAGEEGLHVRASRDQGKTFSPTKPALPGMYGNATVTSDGRLHLVALDGDPKAAYGSPKHAVHYTVSSDAAATFAKPVTVSGAGEIVPFFFSNSSIAVDEARKWIYVVYPRGGRDAVWDLVIAASKDGRTWTRTTIGDGCAIHMVPNVALDPATGTLFVAYYESVGTGRFALASCDPGATKCTPQGAINTVPFAALSTMRHGSKWIGEYEALLFDPKRRLLHAVWSQPVSEPSGVVSRIFHAAAKIDRAAP